MMYDFILELSLDLLHHLKFLLKIQASPQFRNSSWRESSQERQEGRQKTGKEGERMRPSTAEAGRSGGSGRQPVLSLLYVHVNPSRAQWPVVIKHLVRCQSLVPRAVPDSQRDEPVSAE